MLQAKNVTGAGQLSSSAQGSDFGCQGSATVSRVMEGAGWGGGGRWRGGGVGAVGMGRWEREYDGV